MYVEAAEGGDERGVAVVTEETAISLEREGLKQKWSIFILSFETASLAK